MSHDETKLLPERASERASFDADTERLYGGDVALNIASVLRVWHHTAPEGGSYRDMLAIMSNAATRLSESTKAVQVGRFETFAHAFGTNLTPYPDTLPNPEGKRYKYQLANDQWRAWQAAHEAKPIF